MSPRPAPAVPNSEAAPAISPPRAAGRLPFAALVLGNVALAFGPWFVRLADVGPVASGFWRLTLALPLLLVFAALRSRGAPRPGGPAIALVAIGGLFFAVDLAAWHAGILRTRMANAVLFGNVTSFFFTAYGFLLARTWPSRRQGGAILLALAGVVLLMGRSYELSSDHLAGDALCLLAGLTYTGYMIAIDRVRGGLGNARTLAFATLAAAASLLPLALLSGEAVWPHRWGPLVALAIGSQIVGQGLIIFAIGTLPPMVVGLGLLTQPVAAAAIGWIVYGERLTLPDFIGAAGIGLALVMIRRR